MRYMRMLLTATPAFTGSADRSIALIEMVPAPLPTMTQRQVR